MAWTEAGIRKQVLRLKSLPRQEEDRPWAACAPEFDRVLKQLAEDDKHAEQIVNSILDFSRFCPTIPEIREAAAGLAKSREEIRPDPDCSKCGGSGSIVIERNGLSGASRCDCWARRALPRWALHAEPEMPRTEKGMVSAAEIMGAK